MFGLHLGVDGCDVPRLADSVAYSNTTTLIHRKIYSVVLYTYNRCSIMMQYGKYSGALRYMSWYGSVDTTLMESRRIHSVTGYRQIKVLKP